MTAEVYYSYLGSAIIIILIMLLCIQITNRTNKKQKLAGRRTVMIYTPRGLIETDDNDVKQELQAVREKIMGVISVVSEDDEDLTPLINQSIKSLEQFINNNPGPNSASLCQLNLRADAVNQAMYNSVNPNPLDWMGEYRTVLDWEANEREMQTNPRERLKFLVKNIDVAIAMLNNQVCDNGRLNLTKLYIILQYLNKKINVDGSHYLLDGLNDRYYEGATKLKVGDRNNMVQLYALSQEPEPESESWATLSGIVADNGLEGMRASLRHMTDSDPFLDDSLEGSVEHDIIEQQAPGTNLAKAIDTTRFITVVRNSCLGKTPSDETLWENCVQYDARPREALYDNASALICGV